MADDEDEGFHVHRVSGGHAFVPFKIDTTVEDGQLKGYVTEYLCLTCGEVIGPDSPDERIRWGREEETQQ